MPFGFLIWLFLFNYAGPGFNLYDVYEAWPEGSKSYGVFMESRGILGPWGFIENREKTYISYDVIPGGYFSYGSLSFSICLPFRGDKRLGEEKKFIERRLFGAPIFSLKYGKSFASMAYGIKLSIEPPLFERKSTYMRVLNSGALNVEGAFLIDYYINPTLSLHFNLAGYNFDIKKGYSSASDILKAGISLNSHLGTHNPFLKLNHLRFITQDVVYHTPRELYGGPVFSVSLGDRIKKNWLDLSFGLSLFLSKREIRGILPESTSVIPREDMSFSIDLKVGIEKRRNVLPHERGEWIVEVRDQMGRALIAKVTLEPLGKLYETDENGNLLLEDLPPGLYTLSVEREGYEGKRVYITIHPGERGRSRVTLNPIEKRRNITVFVKNAENDSYISATVEVVGDTTYEVDGMGTISVPEDAKILHIYRASMRRATLELTPQDRYTVYLVPQEKSSIRFIVFFEWRSTIIQPQYLKLLEKIANIMKVYPEAHLLLEGHTCLEGGEKFSKLLSERRAEVIRDYFVETFGINMRRIETTGYGDERPIAPTKTESGRIKNRRVEINIVF